jgi:hypothetical protein
LYTLNLYIVQAVGMHAIMQMLTALTNSRRIVFDYANFI